MPQSLDNELRHAIVDAVNGAFDNQIEFLSKLCSFPSIRGREQDIQNFLSADLLQRGYDVDKWAITAEDICDLRGFSPIEAPYRDALNVVGTLHSQSNAGRSLILNGHVDVVPAGPNAMWTTPPFTPLIDGDWIYGRGAGDMKAGLSCNLFAIEALKSLGYRPAANCYL